MTVALETRERAPARVYAPTAAILLGCSALFLRTSSIMAIGPTAAVGILGVVGAVKREQAAPIARALAVTALGISAFVAVRLVAQPLDAAFTTVGVVANVVAAIAEEAFFRRYVYGRLAERSHRRAIVISAALFALVHIPMYGVAVLPLDFAAGLLLGWQRRESGTWASPAITHVVANLLQMR